MRTLNSGRGQTLETPLTDEQAIGCCRRLSDKFAKELASKWDSYQRRRASGRRAWPLSEAQLYWVHKLALGGDNQPPTAADTIGDLAPIVRLFQNVRPHVQFPKIKLVLPMDPCKPDGLRQPLALAWASGATAKYPNTINVTNGTPFGRNTWYGRVLPGGEFYRARQCPEAVIYLLRRFAQDPSGTARENGHLNKVCCFCGQGLTNDRAMEVGYGPICAQHYGLPWGDKKLDLETALGPLGLQLGLAAAAQEPGKPLFDDPRVQAEYERLVNKGMPPSLAEERAFDPLIAEADRLDQLRADAH